MRKTLLALLGILLVAALAGAGTFAAFSDTEQSTGNTFTAGTLDLQLESNKTIPFNIANVKPGDPGTITYTFKNAGSIDGYLTLKDIEVIDKEGSNPESETNTDEPGDLSANMNIVVKLNGNQVWTGTLKDWSSAGQLKNLPLPAGQTATLEINYSISNDVGNDIQGDEVTAKFTAELTQNQVQ